MIQSNDPVILKYIKKNNNKNNNSTILICFIMLLVLLSRFMYLYLWVNGRKAEDLGKGGEELGDSDRLCRLGGLGARPKAPSGGNRWLVKIGGGGSKSINESNEKSGDTVGNGMSTISSSKSLDEFGLSVKKKKKKT